MKRASTDTQALVYAYRCAHPIRAQRDDTGRHMLDDAAFAACLAEQQRARALWDRLVDIDAEAARTETDIARANVPAIAAVIDRIIGIKAQLAPLFEARAIDRKKARKKIATQHDAAIDELSAQRREARAELWAALKQWRGLSIERPSAPSRLRVGSMLSKRARPAACIGAPTTRCWTTTPAAAPAAWMAA